MNTCLIVVWSKAIHLITSPESPRKFTFEGQRFVGQFKTDNNGFFDWLRNSNHKIIGVRWSALDELDAKLVTEQFSDSHNVKVDISCRSSDSL